MNQQQNMIVAAVLAALGLYLLFAPKEFKAQYLPSAIVEQPELYHQIAGAVSIAAAYYFYKGQKFAF
jgi:hypothetical protein